MEMPLSSVEKPLLKMSTLIWYVMVPITTSVTLGGRRVPTVQEGKLIWSWRNVGSFEMCDCLKWQQEGVRRLPSSSLTLDFPWWVGGSCNGSFLWKLLGHWYPTDSTVKAVFLLGELWGRIPLLFFFWKLTHSYTMPGTHEGPCTSLAKQHLRGKCTSARFLWLKKIQWRLKSTGRVRQIIM